MFSFSAATHADEPTWGAVLVAILLSNDKLLAAVRSGGTWGYNIMIWRSEAMDLTVGSMQI